MPKKMYVILHNSGHVTWDNTREMIINNPQYFSDGYRDFGVGAEPYFTCPGCTRQLPVYIGALDHILSQGRYVTNNLGADRKNDAFVVLNSQMDQITEAEVIAIGGTVTIKKRKYDMNPVVMHAATIWLNDLRNLQFICSGCNSSKGDKDWIDWKGGVGTRPFSQMWKTTAPND